MPNFRALRPTLEKLFTGAKVWRKAQKMGAGRENFYEIDPRLCNKSRMGSYKCSLSSMQWVILSALFGY